MPTEQTNPYGYDIVDEIPRRGGIYLSLKEKGQQVQIRLVSQPVYVKRYWITNPSGKKEVVVVPKNGPDPYGGEDVPVKERLEPDFRFGWVVIDREDESVKLFQGSKSVAFKIKNISEMRDKAGNVIWGNPTGYDLLVTRTEQQGANYYTVDPLPHTRKPLTEEEKELVKEAGIDPLKEMEGSQVSNTSGHNTATPADLETVPEAEEKKTDSVPGVKAMKKEEDDNSSVWEKLDVDDVNDDIPF